MEIMKSIDKQFSLKHTLSKVLLFAIITPMAILAISESIISSGVLVEEFSRTEERYVRLLSNSLENKLINPVKELSHLTELLNVSDVSEDHIDFIAESMVSVHPEILSIEITDKEGVIENIYPYDSSKIGLDISGYEYFKKSINQIEPYWSASFLSSHFESSAVSVSYPYQWGLVTIFLSLEDITLKDIENNTDMIFSITDQLGVFVYHMNYDLVRFREQDEYFNVNKSQWNGEIIQRVIDYNGVKYFSYSNFIPELNWMVTLYKPISIIIKPLIRSVVILVLITLILLFLGTRFARSIIRNITDPIEALVEFTKKLSTGNHNVSIPSSNIRELTVLTDSFSSMADSIRLSEDGLKKQVKIRTRELEESQEQLILSEKMAALGGLVAGVAHEINTPVGIIVTSSSYLEMSIEELDKLHLTGKLSKSKFNEINSNIKETSKLILSNSRRAAELIKSFKEVAVDQTSGDRRLFNLGEYTREVIQSLYHSYKNTGITVDIDISDEIQMDTFPGAYSQIITNLLTNSLIHGFDKEKKGTIKIKITSEDNKNATIVFTDSGKGIETGHIHKIFDPFFTTRRNSGGSGLGLHIVYNLVTQKLLGSIECGNVINNGAKFTITIPIKINSDL